MSGSLAQQIRKSRRLRCNDMRVYTRFMSDLPCICISLRRASRRLTAAYDEALAPLGLNLAQFSLLRNIDRQGSVSLTRLSDITELDRSTLGRNVRVLGRLGLAQLAGSADKREALVTLSADGRRKLAAALPVWRAVQQTIDGKLGGNAPQLQALLGAL